MKELINKIFGDLFNTLHFEKNFSVVTTKQLSIDENVIKSEMKFSTPYKGKHNYIKITISYSLNEKMMLLEKIDSIEYKIDTKFFVEENMIIDRFFQIIDSIPKQK